MVYGPFTHTSLSSLLHSTYRSATMGSTTPTKMDFIPQLPVELQLDIFDLLKYEDALRLSQVNKYFRNIIDPESKSTAEKANFLFQAQYFTQHDTYRTINNDWGLPVYLSENVKLACFACLKLKPMEAFSSRKVVECFKHDTGDNTIDQSLRYCIECSIDRRSLKHGTEVNVIKKLWFVHKPHTPHYWRLRSMQDIICTRYCDVCKELHPENEWTCGAHTNKDFKDLYVMKESKLRKTLAKFKKAHDAIHMIKPISRMCKLCMAFDTAIVPEDLFCPTCRTWLCHRCRPEAPLATGKVRGNCGPGGEMHDLMNGYEYQGIRELLEKVETGREDGVAGLGTYMLADVEFLKEE